MLIVSYIKDAVGILDAELELLNFRIKYSKEFPKPTVESWKSLVYFADEVAHMAMMEVIKMLPEYLKIQALKFAIIV